MAERLAQSAMLETSSTILDTPKGAALLASDEARMVTEAGLNASAGGNGTRPVEIRIWCRQADSSSPDPPRLGDGIAILIEAVGVTTKEATLSPFDNRAVIGPEIGDNFRAVAQSGDRLRRCAMD